MGDLYPAILDSRRSEWTLSAPCPERRAIRHDRRAGWPSPASGGWHA